MGKKGDSGAMAGTGADCVWEESRITLSYSEVVLRPVQTLVQKFSISLSKS